MTRFAISGPKLVEALAKKGVTATQAAVLVDEMLLIHQLRREEGDAVTVFCDNPDFSGPNCGIEVCGDWTGYQDRRFVGDTLIEALSAASAARAGKRVPNER